MKFVYILIAVIAIAGLAYLFVGNQADAPTDGVETPAEESEAENTTSEADDNSTEMDANDADAEAEMGSDAGMEFPQIDAEGDASAEVDSGDATTVTLDGFNFGFSQEEIRVEEGETVTIELTSTDGLHDWVVDEFDASTERVNEGETVMVTFVADTAGTYEYYCSVGNHREQGMVGTLIVE